MNESSALPEPGQEPEEYRHQREVFARIRSGKTSAASPTPVDPHPSTAEPEFTLPPDEAPVEEALPERPPARPTDAKSQLLDFLRRYGKSQKITLKAAGVTFSFNVMDVSVLESSIGLCMDEGLLFELAPDTEADLTIDGETHPVLYVGQFFTFRGLPFPIMCFVKKPS